MNRRNLLKATAWSIPAVTLATAAPAYATSTTPAVPDVSPVACRRPGLGKDTKDYFLRTKHRDGVVVFSVLINGRLAAPTPHGWGVFKQKDSRLKRSVTITYAVAGSHKTLRWTGEVEFPVCKER